LLLAAPCSLEAGPAIGPLLDDAPLLPWLLELCEPPETNSISSKDKTLIELSLSYEKKQTKDVACRKN
jgi:hypothetical protein